MIYELRVYRAMPGRLPNVVARFKDHTTGIWDRLGIKHVGFWTTLVGGSEIGELTYMIAWESLAEREAKWAIFIADAEWLSAKGETEKDGPIVAEIHNKLLTPTAFSKMQ
ncbi:NIPSNAP family protein [Variovorax sp. J22R133]|uniref:NIPSNAP family protein n=1 Tax=Variovorax brevis TaxID=3053503 RepID=UPI002575D11E|nr:NIPSNAP family protein [Variovorax sp. J22R133]MDM0110646.1 NIPSNAP family protein [Variovorax sp. J22R133]